jgi:predicted RNA-binding protein Jag
MSVVPEKHVVAEGRSLRGAIEAAAKLLGVNASLVQHKIDMAHFRSAQGAGVGSDTVKIFAWSRDPQELAGALAAEEWMKGLVAAMGHEGSVRSDASGNAVVLHVDVGEAGRYLVGRGGATLRAIQYLLEQSLGRRFPDNTFRIDVARAEEERPSEERRGERREARRDDGPRREEGRRDDRRDRGDRGDRGGDRGRGPRGGDRPRRSDTDVEDLKRLARKIAEKVADSGEAQVIRRELNSFDRRIVHVEVATIAGVASRSVGEGHDRRIEIYPSEGGGEGSDEGGEDAGSAGEE